MRFLCRIGLHLSTFTDVSMFGSMRYCNLCGAPENRRRAQRIERQAAVCQGLPSEIPFEERVMIAMLSDGDMHKALAMTRRG